MGTFDFYTPLSQIGRGITDSWNQGVKRESLADLGRNYLTGPEPNYGGAAQHALGMGDAELGMTLLALGEKQRLRKATEEGDRAAFDGVANAYGGQAAGATPPARLATLPATASPAAMLPPGAAVTEASRDPRIDAGVSSAMSAPEPALTPQVAARNRGMTSIIAQAAALPDPSAQGTAAPIAPAADVPAQGATEAQFVIPGTDQSVPASMVSSKLIALTNAARKARSPEARAVVNTAIQNEYTRLQAEEKERRQDARGPESVQEFVYAKRMGWTTANSPAEYAAEKRDDKGDEVTKVAAARRSEADRLGLREGSPERTRYIAEGKIGSDEKPDRKAIQEADASVSAAQSTISAMQEARQLSAKAYDGTGAGIRGSISANFGGERGVATELLTNTVTQNAVSSLKSIFGGNPTEGERKVLLDIAGSVNQPRAVRDEIFSRAERLASERLKVATQKADELRAGTYFRPGGGGTAVTATGKQDGRVPQAAPSGRPPGGIPSGAVQMLQGDPSLAAAFDQKYGAGASRSVLGQ